MAKKSDKQKRDEKRLHVELASQMVQLSTAGFGLVAALAWNEAIQQFVKDFIEPRIPGSGLISKFFYALFITVLAVFITYQLSRLAAHFQHRKD